MKQGTRVAVSTSVDASPAAVYDTITDLRRMGEWSPECRRCIWMDGATGPVVGARFKGHNRRGLLRWSTTSRVAAAEAAREFTFVTSHLGRPMTRWSYELEPSSDGTIVTESFEMVHDMPWYFIVADRWFMKVPDRKADLEANIEKTLTRLKSAVEKSDSAR